MGGRNIPFLKRYKIDSVTGCWIFIGMLDKDGYGRIRYKGRSTPAHRVFYLELKGTIPENHHLDHLKEKCKRRDCVNPDHLEPVTTTENTRRGRNTKLTPAQVLEIRKLALTEKSDSVIAYQFKIDATTVYNIRVRRTWRDI